VKILLKTIAAAAFASMGVAALAAPLPLPPGYPALLGASCGGVHLSSFVTGFDSNGNVSGEVYAWTKCGGSGKGGGYKATTYQSWHSITWTLSKTYTVNNYDSIAPDPLFTETDQYGNFISNVCSGTTNGQPACVADAVIVYAPPPSSGLTYIVPNEFGKTQTQAMADVKAVGLTPYVTYYTYGTATYPPGTVFNQSPAAGTQSTEGAQVHLYVFRLAN
jgi:hypothetical protein